MDKHFKIGIVAGLVAGIAAGIIAIINILFLFNIGRSYYDLPSPPETSMIYITMVELTINIIWGIALGIFYSKVYDLIPGKGVYKGLFYGLVLWLILNVRNATFNVIYEPHGIFKQILGISIQIVYGLLLGILYEFLQNRYHPVRKKVRIGKQNLIEGIHPGAIAGLIGGIVIFVAHALLMNPLLYPKFVTDIGWLIGQLGTHALINMCWGVIFGIFFVMLYNGIPGNKVLKGVTFAMIIFFITSLRVAFYWLSYESIGGFVGWINGIYLFLIFGIILGYLYKPTK
ncbi:MAG: hypothetical protein NWF08_01840 [Candidatus Bathyarchaeota archaeon]|nr:hypothetical protein [Candidatus Bathyarchaeota archaeon]